MKNRKFKLLYLLGSDNLEFQKNDEFIVYQGSHGDRGAEIADLVLPSAAFTEQNGYFTNLEGKLQKAYRASFPPGEAKEDYKILNELSELLKRKKLFQNKDELIDNLLNYLDLNQKKIQSKNFSSVDYIDEKIIIETLNQFSKYFHESLKKHFCWRMGIQDIDSKNLNEIMTILLNESEKNKIDYANMFYDFYGGRDSIIDCIKTNYGKKYKINEFSKIVDILKETLPAKGVLEKKNQLDNNRQNLLIGEVEHIWREIDQNDNWKFLHQKINNIRKLGYLLKAEKLVNL